MSFWEILLSPAGLAIAIISALLGSFVTHLLERSAKRKDDEKEMIVEIAKEYRALAESHQDNGLHALQRSGIYRLRSHEQVEQLIAEITAFGLDDPLGRYRQQLEGKDVRHFFDVLKQNNLNSLREQDCQVAIDKTNKL